jgi:hypothetical protein
MPDTTFSFDITHYYFKSDPLYLSTHPKSNPHTPILCTNFYLPQTPIVLGMQRPFQSPILTTQLPLSSKSPSTFSHSLLLPDPRAQNSWPIDGIKSRLGPLMVLLQPLHDFLAHALQAEFGTAVGTLGGGAAGGGRGGCPRAGGDAVGGAEGGDLD